ncbi:hypothetical protein Tco_1117987, partial [Tanacetum coccineum]
TRFEIFSLSGSFMTSEVADQRSRIETNKCLELSATHAAGTINIWNGIMPALAVFSVDTQNLGQLNVSWSQYKQQKSQARATGTGDVLNYAFLASRLQSVGLQTKLLRHSGILASGPTFDDALSTFSLSPRQMALWKSQMEDHTSDWLRAVPISGLGQTMNACSRVFAEDIYRDHDVSCAGIINIKHRHNVVRDTLVNICYRSGISAGKEIDIGLEGGCDKPLRPADMLLYSWDGGLDVCVDLTGSSPLTQTEMTDFVPDRAVIDAAQRKRVKYEAKCATIGYGFLHFSFFSLGELEKDAVSLLKRI